eukprot:SAG31_NODE_474_length_15176_cov_7.362340_13_plen_65_part_00
MRLQVITMQALTTTCDHSGLSIANQEFHDSRVLPFVHMTVKGFLWYQVRTSTRPSAYCPLFSVV